LTISKRQLRAADLIFAVLAVLVCLGFTGCERAPSEGGEVVVYTSVDQVYAKRVLDRFEQATGIQARAVFDTEAGKTTGLYHRLLSKRKNPDADVFWNGEICRTIQLAEAGLAGDLSALVPPGIPKRWVDASGRWVAFSLRARVIVYNTNMLEPNEAPRTLSALTDEKWRGRVAMANPLFGTTATHMAALYEKLGEEQAEAFLRALKDNDVRLEEGNSMVRDVVARGEAPVGLTDTDDVFAGIAEQMPIAFVLPDQQGMGTFVIPNTVMLLADGPNPEPARKLVRFLLLPEVEEMLAHERARQVPVRAEVPCPEDMRALLDLHAMEVDYARVAARMPDTARWLEEVFLR